eukprot:gene3631-3257_t
MLGAAMTGGCTACAFRRVCDAGVALTHVGIVATWNPYARNLRLPVSIAAHLLLAASATVFVYGYLSPSCAARVEPLPGHAEGQLLLGLGAVLVVATVCVDILGWLRGYGAKGRRQRLRGLLEQFAAIAADGDGGLQRGEL